MWWEAQSIWFLERRIFRCGPPSQGAGKMMWHCQGHALVSAVAVGCVAVRAHLAFEVLGAAVAESPQPGVFGYRVGLGAQRGALGFLIGSDDLADGWATARGTAEASDVAGRGADVFIGACGVPEGAKAAFAQLSSPHPGEGHVSHHRFHARLEIDQLDFVPHHCVQRCICGVVWRLDEYIQRWGGPAIFVHRLGDSCQPLGHGADCLQDKVSGLRHVWCAVSQHLSRERFWQLVSDADAFVFVGFPASFAVSFDPPHRVSCGFSAGGCSRYGGAVWVARGYLEPSGSVLPDNVNQLIFHGVFEILECHGDFVGTCFAPCDAGEYTLGHLYAGRSRVVVHRCDDFFDREGCLVRRVSEIRVRHARARGIRSRLCAFCGGARLLVRSWLFWLCCWLHFCICLVWGACWCPAALVRCRAHCWPEVLCDVDLSWRACRLRGGGDPNLLVWGCGGSGGRWWGLGGGGFRSRLALIARRT